jgi:hypothetical protein
MVSADGIVWSIQTVADEMNVALNDVQWSKELSSFLISGQGSFFTSPNGYNWTRQAAPSSSSWSSAVWVPERNSWTAITSNNGLSGAAISANGSSWNIQRVALFDAYLNLAWSPVLKIFISVGIFVFPSMSSDGVSWYANNDAISRIWGSVIWVPSLGQFVGVSREPGESFRLLSTKTLSEGAFVSRFNAQNGTRYWTRVYTQPRLSVFNVRPTATVMSANNVLYLGGYSTGDFNDAIAPNTVSKAYLVAMNPNNGSVLWTRIWGSSGATQLYSMDLDVGRQFLYTAGSTIGSIDGVKTAKSGSDVFICEHRASNGTMNNCWQFGTAGDDFAYSILVENNQGTILVAGSTNGFFNNNILASSTDVLLVRFNATSGQIVENLSFPNDGSDAFLSLTRDNETGNIFCTGYVSAWSQPLNLRQTYGAGRDILLASFNPNMTIRFMRLAGSPLVETGFSLVYYRSAQQLLIASDYNRRGTLLNFSLPLEPAAVTTTSTATGNSATTSTVSVKTLLTSASTTSSSVSEPRYSSTPTIADPTTPSTAPIGADFTSIFSSPSFIIGIAVLGAILVSIMIGMAILVKRVSYLRRKSMAYEKLDRSYSVGQGFSSHAKQAASGLGTFAMMSPFSEDIYPRKFPTNSVTAEPTVNLTLRGSETTSDFTQSLEQQYSTQTVTF